MRATVFTLAGMLMFGCSNTEYQLENELESVSS